MKHFPIYLFLFLFISYTEEKPRHTRVGHWQRDVVNIQKDVALLTHLTRDPLGVCNKTSN